VSHSRASGLPAGQYLLAGLPAMQYLLAGLPAMQYLLAGLPAMQYLLAGCQLDALVRLRFAVLHSVAESYKSAAT
jgi:hypothetical protein